MIGCDFMPAPGLQQIVVLELRQMGSQGGVICHQQLLPAHSVQLPKRHPCMMACPEALLSPTLWKHSSSATVPGDARGSHVQPGVDTDTEQKASDACFVAHVIRVWAELFSLMLTGYVFLRWHGANARCN